jgi:hypothetical protein
MTDFAALPADITPGQFLSLVEAALAHEPAPAGAAPDKLVIHVSGEAGGAWSMGFEDGRLRITEGASANAPLQLSLATDDLRAFVAGAIRDAILARAGGRTVDARQIGKLFAVTHKTEQIKAYSGNLQIAVEAPAATHRLTLTFGGGAPNPVAPSTTVSFALDDFLAILGGELNPQAAFFAGRIRLDGDMNLAMGLMALAMG